MAIFDFGKLAGAMASARESSVSRDISPPYTGVITSAEFNTGSFFDAISASQAISGTPDEFLMAVHKWDDLEHKVT